MLNPNGLRHSFYRLYDSPEIEPSTGSYGRWAIRLSEVTIRYYWKKRDAVAWLARYMAAEPDKREAMAGE